MYAQSYQAPECLTGLAVSKGAATGPAFILPPQAAQQALLPDTVSDGDLVEEVVRLDHALEEVQADLRQLQTVSAQLASGQISADILDAQLMMLGDPSIAKKARRHLKRGNTTAEAAVRRTIGDIIAMLGNLNHVTLRDRAADFRDLQTRLLDALAMRQPRDLKHLPEGAIVVTDELLPSIVISLATRKPGAFIAATGSPTSHATIIARSWGIPCVVGVEQLLDHVSNGQLLHVDGSSGQVVLNAETAFTLPVVVGQPLSHEGEDLVPSDSAASHISLAANVNQSHDLEGLTDYQMKGVGLYRSELYYLQQRQQPSRYQQAQDYGRVAIAAAPYTAVLRTFDFTHDKCPAFWQGQSLDLRDPARVNLLQDQLHAALSACHTYSNIAILFPMVRSTAELEFYLEQFNQVFAVMSLETRPLIGSMIETVSAVEDLPAIAKQVDFLSIGSNDLAADLLQVSRDSVGPQDARNLLMEPALLRVVNYIIETSRLAQRPISICGEAASDPVLSSLFVGLGLRMLSIGPCQAQPLRQSLSRISLKEAQIMACQATTATSADEIWDLLKASLPTKTAKMLRLRPGRRSQSADSVASGTSVPPTPQRVSRRQLSISPAPLTGNLAQS